MGLCTIVMIKAIHVCTLSAWHKVSAGHFSTSVLTPFPSGLLCLPPSFAFFLYSFSFPSCFSWDADIYVLIYYFKCGVLCA
jgi:hypothetical protein